MGKKVLFLPWKTTICEQVRIKSVAARGLEIRRSHVDKRLNVEYYINMSTSFGEELRVRRRAAGISQRTLADLAGVDFTYISKLENGRLPAPAVDTILRLAEMLKCPVEVLLAAAQRMPQQVERDLSRDPTAQRFLREASELDLSAEEWERLRGSLRSLRSEGRRRRGR